VIVPVFIAATVASNALAVGMLVRGLRATTRSGCGDRGAWCVLLAIIQGGVMVAALLSKTIGAAARLGSIGMLASLPPVVFAAVLFVPSRRSPPSG
jgi:hypothetical protein